MVFKGHVVGWTAPTYVSVGAFTEASGYVGGYDASSVYLYHSNTFASRINQMVRDNGGGVFVRQIGKDYRQGEVLFSLVLEKKFPDSLKTYPDVVFRLPMDINQQPRVVHVGPMFPVSKDTLQFELEQVCQQVCSASVIAKMVRYITRRGALALRKGGGAYFIPSARGHLLELVENTLFALDGEVMKFAVTGQDYELKTIFESLKEHFRMMVGQLRMRALQAKREKTQERLHKELAELIDTVSIYKDILGSYSDQLDAILEQSKRELVESLSIKPVQTQEIKPTVLMQMSLL